MVPWYRVWPETNYGVWLLVFCEGLLAIRTFFILTTCKSGKVLSVQFKRAGHFIRSYKLKYREYVLTYVLLWQSKRGEFLLLKRKKYANGSKSIFLFFDFLFGTYARLTRFLILVAVVKISLKKNAPLHLFWYFISLREVAFKLYPYLEVVKQSFCKKAEMNKKCLYV